MSASTHRGRIVALALAATAAAAAAPQALGAGTAGAAPRLTADAVVVGPGGTLTLHGSGFPHDAHLTLLAGPPQRTAVRIGSAATGTRGRFSALIRIRAHAAAATLVATACDRGCRVKASVRFRIAAP